jgi:hypothetical protein
VSRHVVALALAAFLVNLPLVHGTLTGQAVGPVVVVTLIADAAIVTAALLLWRLGGRDRTPEPPP